MTLPTRAVPSVETQKARFDLPTKQDYNASISDRRFMA